MSQGIKTLYKEKVIPSLMENFNYKNIHEVPKIVKVTLNRGLGEASRNAKSLEASITELALITGQQPVICRSKKSVAGFKIRENMPVGLFVTLRKEKMYSFIERFVHLTLPRIRDFRGIDSKSFDGKGNYNLGIQEQLIFPEIKYEDVDQIRGLDISFVTTAKTDEEGLHLLKGIGMPFKK
uniref:Large ribosomal subunit protein uL5c n=1 Tax=Haptophyceae sp. NIES-3900 TaxID=2748608 RepID=A0A7R6WE05_9EUKA|nr:ribosomal protein L5 [Haptophyceae sp. NIES-3900]